MQPLVPGQGKCLASDRVIVDGCPVGFMYREPPLDAQDSGWRFLAGDEDADYMADLSRHGVYEVNMIANFDAAIIEHLQAPVGSRVLRDPSGALVPAMVPCAVATV
ncbi:MAG: DUF2185 domain-containing protein [Gammaproteobacteria bacterium]|nr:DUF2185 domain-containing protein [Gammaproteobacteria bacterium]